MNRHTSRLNKLATTLEPLEEMVIVIQYVRDWRGDMRDVVEEKRIVLGGNNETQK